MGRGVTNMRHRFWSPRVRGWSTRPSPMVATTDAARGSPGETCTAPHCIDSPHIHSSLYCGGGRMPTTLQLTGTRTYLEVRVGAFHSAEVLLHLRRDHVDWFQAAATPSKTEELLSLLQHNILPRMFAEELEVSHAQQTRTPLPPRLGMGGVPLEAVGERNAAPQPSLPQRNHKRKRQLTKKQVAAELARQQRDRTEKDVYYAFGTSMQLAYRLEDSTKRKPTVTLVFHQEPKTQDHQDRPPRNTQTPGDMQQLIKLSHRIVLWCYPYDPSQPIEPDPPGGMPRPEMIPLSNLFRNPIQEEVKH